MLEDCVQEVANVPFDASLQLYGPMSLCFPCSSWLLLMYLPVDVRLANVVGLDLGIDDQRLEFGDVVNRSDISGLRLKL